jgi:hypothetical protein
MGTAQAWRGPQQRWRLRGQASCQAHASLACMHRPEKKNLVMNCLIPVSIPFDFSFLWSPGLRGQAHSLETQGAGQPSAAKEASIDFFQPWHSHRASHRGTSRLFHSGRQRCETFFGHKLLQRQQAKWTTTQRQLALGCQRLSMVCRRSVHSAAVG